MEQEHRGGTPSEVDPVREVGGGHGGHQTAEMCDVRRVRVGCGFRGGARKRFDGRVSGQRQNFGHVDRPEDDRS